MVSGSAWRIRRILLIMSYSQILERLISWLESLAHSSSEFVNYGSLMEIQSSVFSLVCQRPLLHFFTFFVFWENYSTDQTKWRMHWLGHGPQQHRLTIFRISKFSHIRTPVELPILVLHWICSGSVFDLSEWFGVFGVRGMTVHVFGKP